MTFVVCSEVYHTKRMQRIFCVKWSSDAKFVLSGSDETNIRYDWTMSQLSLDIIIIECIV